MNRFYFLAFLLVAGMNVNAQKSPVKFGKIDPQNLKMTTYALDSSAGAVVLFDWGYSTFDHNFDVSFERHVRIKILNKSEFDRANVKIPHGRRDMVERLKATTYNLENGEMVESELDKKAIMDEKVNKYVDRMVFSLPNVKEGSIIEYTYRVNYGSWNRINPWYFQKEIPVMYSEYLVELPDMFEYQKIMTGYIPLDDAEVTKRNINYQGTPLTLISQRFVAKDVPAFKEEPYMTTKEDYISKILFELHTFSIPGRAYEKVMPDSYAQLSVRLAKNENIGQQIEKGRFLRDEVETVTAGITDPKEKAMKLYSYVQDRFTVDRNFYEENYKKIFDEKRGYEQDINFILVMMLKEADLNAELVFLSTRENGRVHPYYPSVSNFNYFIGLLTIGEEQYLLDASDKDLPFAMISEECLNGKGLVISEDRPRWVDLVPVVDNLKMITGIYSLSEDGSIEGDLKINRRGYSAIGFKKDFKEDKEKYQKGFADKHDWSIEDHKFNGLDSISSSLSETLHLRDDSFAESLGDLIYLNPIIYGKVESSPFKEDERLYPINYGAPFKEIQTFRISLPENYVIDEMPKPAAVALPGHAGKFLYNVVSQNNVLVVSAHFEIDKVEFTAQEYNYLREFYSQFVAKEAEQIVLKKKI